jgi:hypothetical protein
MIDAIELAGTVFSGLSALVRHAAIEGTLQVKGHDTVLAPTGGHGASVLLWA